MLFKLFAQIFICILCSIYIHKVFILPTYIKWKLKKAARDRADYLCPCCSYSVDVENLNSIILNNKYYHISCYNKLIN